MKLCERYANGEDVCVLNELRKPRKDLLSYTILALIAAAALMGFAAGLIHLSRL